MNTISSMTDIDETAVARGLNAKAQIAERQSIDQPIDNPAPLLTNAVTRLDALAAIAPDREYLCANGIVTSLGYYIANALLWEFRNANKVNTEDDEVIPEGIAPRVTDVSDLGLSQLPRMDGKQFLAAYKRLYFMQKGSAYAANMPPKKLKDIALEMITNGKVDQVKREYDRLHAAELSTSKSAAAIQHKMANRAQSTTQFTKRNEAELAYIVDTFNFVAHDALDDELWQQMPLWLQYKYCVMIYNGIIQQIAIDIARDEQHERRQVLLNMADDILLELEAAARKAEVKQAFAEGRLDERHVLEHTAPNTPAVLQ